MTASSTAGPRLDLGAALRDGWSAFRRAPWSFTGFILLSAALTVALDAVNSAFTPEPGDLPAFLSPLPLLCQLASVVVSLWAGVGMVRGAWIALEGGQPRFIDLVRWDGSAIKRVLLASLLMGLILMLIALPLSLLVVAGLDQMFDFDFSNNVPMLRSFTPSFGAILLCLGAVLTFLMVLAYVQVNQHFLVQLASLRGTGAVRTLTEGRAVVDRQWWRVLGLMILESLLLLAGFLALLVGLVVALPVTICISTAAYRQLFGPTAPAGELPAA